MIGKYSKQSDGARKGLLANANVGGENVHRGAVLGAILGAHTGLENLHPRLIEGLHNRVELAEEIDNFVKSVMGSSHK